MAASWCHLRFWYKKTGEKFHKHRRLLNCRQASRDRGVLRQFSSSASTAQKDNFHKLTYDAPTPKGNKKDTDGPMPVAYSPQYVESVWYDWWLSKGFFNTNTGQVLEKGRGECVMLLPPPNVTGTLHLGHALTCSIQDAIIRWHRMRGDVAVWVPGMDHAGIATQVVVEKTLWAEQGKTRHQIGRHAFHDLVCKWKQEKGHVIEEQMIALGSSFDWNRNFFTLDEKRSRAVTEAFVRLHEKGKIYRSSQLVNWSCSLQSSISDIEVENVSVDGRTKRKVPGYEKGVEFGVLSSFAYPVENSSEEIVVSTTRLETMLGDTAVAVHPDDSRYSHLIGRRVRHPLCQRSIPVIGDSFVDRGFGSGAVKITPGHDPVDHDVGVRHGLPAVSILDDEGKICGDGVPPQLAGVPRFSARETVKAMLVDLDLYRGEVPHSMVLPVCSRSGDVVEARLKEQWFLSCKDMARRAVQAVESGELRFSAPHFEAVWFEWLNNIKDWCLSRQLWWGHRIPAYRLQLESGDTWVCARSEREAVEQFHQLHPGMEYKSIIQDEDVLDTWFSSALLPFSIFGWPEKTPDLRQYYPLSLMETGQDILFFWVARMVMLGLELTDSLPFKQVLLHGIVRDAQGRKMSKSLGNVIDPMDVITGASLQDLHSKLDGSRLSPAEIQTAQDGQRKDFPRGIPECGADALRFTLCSYDFKGDAIPMDILHTRTYRLFCNKVWQSYKFTQQHLSAGFTPLDTFTLSGHETAVDLWILSRLSEMVSVCDEAFKTHNLQSATKALHLFWLNDFCDVYLECSKTVFQSSDPLQQEAVRQILYHATNSFLRALSPFMPFLSEELFQRLPAKGADWPESVCVAPYPQPNEYQWQNKELEGEVRQALDVCQHVLSVRQEYNISKVTLPVFIIVKSEGQQRSLSKLTAVLTRLCKADPVTVVTDASGDCGVPVGCATAVVSDACQVHIQLKGYVDLSKELERLTQKRNKISEQQQSVAERLADLVKKGKGHIPAAQKLQAKEQSLTAQLKMITDNMETMTRLHNS